MPTHRKGVMNGALGTSMSRSNFGVLWVVRLEQEREEEHRCRRDTQSDVRVEVRQGRGLCHQGSVDHSQTDGLRLLIAGPDAMRVGGCGLEAHPQTGRCGCNVLAEAGDVELLAAGEDGCYHRSANAAPDVSHEVGQPGDRVALVLRNPKIGGSYSRDEDKAEGVICKSMMTQAPPKPTPKLRSFADRYNPTAERNQPKVIRYFAGILVESNPMTGMVTKRIAAPAETTRPACWALYPASSWRNWGMRIVEENITAPARNIIKLILEKLKFRNTLMSTSGSLCRSGPHCTQMRHARLSAPRVRIFGRSTTRSARLRELLQVGI